MGENYKWTFDKEKREAIEKAMPDLVEQFCRQLAQMVLEEADGYVWSFDVATGLAVREYISPDDDEAVVENLGIRMEIFIAPDRETASLQARVKTKESMEEQDGAELRVISHDSETGIESVEAFLEHVLGKGGMND